MRLLFLLGLFIPQVVFSQINKDSIHFSGYTEVYFSKDQHNWQNHQRPDFLYSHTSTNHIALNTAALDFKYSSHRLKTHLSLIEGTYANKVTAAEPIGFGALYVGNISYKLSSKENLWIQAGVIPSHIGLESAIGFSNLSLSRSLAAENSPYYESGIALQYSSKDDKFYGSLLALNGWQTMSLAPQQSRLGIGSQIQFKPNKCVTLNHSTYYGEVPVLVGSQMRFFQNLFGNIQLKKNWIVQFQADYGIQETENNGFNKNWLAGFLGLAFNVNDKLTLVGRGELLKDENNLVISGVNNDLWGYSFNINYLLDEHLLFRAEWRNITTNSYTFTFQNYSEKQMNGLNLSLAAQF
jgi:hypothetical protein